MATQTTNAKPTPSSSPNDPNMIIARILATSLPSAQSSTLAAIQGEIINLNANLKSNYLTAFSNWALNVLAGRADNSNPPQPPKAYVVGYFDDPTTGKGSYGPYGDTPVQWAYPMQGNDPVCAMPPVPSVITYAPGKELIGTAEKDAPGWFSAQQNDATPPNTIAAGTSEDGVSGLFKKWGAPVGPGWFEKVG